MTVNKKLIVVGILVASLLLALVGLTFAYYQSQTDEKINTFNTGGVDVEIPEVFPKPDPDSDTAQKQAQLQNTGSVRAYVRAMIVPTFRGDGESYGCDVDYSYVDSDGYILVTGGPNADSVFRLHLTEGWEIGWQFVAGSNTFCYREILPPGGTTTYLLDYISRENADSWETLNVDILAEALQTGGEDAINHLHEVWGVTRIGETGTLHWD